MTGQSSNSGLAAHRPLPLRAFAFLLCASACATQGNDTGGRPAQLPGAGDGAGGAPSTVDAGSGGAAGSAGEISGGAPAAADAALGGGGSTSSDAAVQELPPECVFDEAELNEPMDLSAEEGSASRRVARCLVTAETILCGSPTSWGFSGVGSFCPDTTVGDVARCAGGILQLSPELCSSTPVLESSECAGIGVVFKYIGQCTTTDCSPSACPQPPPGYLRTDIPISPGLFTPCCTLQGECGFISFDQWAHTYCKPGTDTDWPWSASDAD